MSLGTRAKAGVLAAILSIVVGFGLFWYLRKANHASAENSFINGNPATTTGKGNLIIWDSTKENALAEPFAKGALPQPLLYSDNDADNAAIVLAKRVSANDENSAAAFLAALQKAGIAVRSPDGRFLIGEANSGQGIALHDWEVAALLKLYGEGLTLKLQDVADALTIALPEFKGAPTADLILKSVTKDMESDKPGLRFWARFLAGLWKQSPATPCNLETGDCDPAKIHIDPLQFALILHRLAGDIVAASHKAALKPVSFRPFREPRTHAMLQNALLHSFEPPHLILIDTPTAAPALPSCAADGAQGTIEDIAALGLTTGMGELLGYLEEKGIAGAGVYARNATIVSLLMTYVNFIATYATLDTQITMEGAPLIRTKNSQPGQKRTLTAFVKQDIGNWQFLNCLRQALNTLGVDVGLPADGGVDGAEIRWTLLHGGSQWNSDTGVLTPPIVGFANPGKTFQGGEAVDFTVTTTDKGYSKIDLEGAPQRNYLSESAVPVNKEAQIQFTIAVKPASFSSDATSAIGDLLSGPLAVLTIPLDMLYRSKWYPSKSYTAPVTDWQECGKGWSGVVTKTFTVQKNEKGAREAIPGLPGKRWSLDLDGNQTERWEFSGESGPNPYLTVGALTATVASSRVSKEFGWRLPNDTCGVKSELNLEEKSQGNVTGKAYLSVYVVEQTGIAHINVNPVPGDKPGLIHRTRSMTGYGEFIGLGERGCHIRRNPANQNGSSDEPFVDEGTSIDDAPVDPAHPNILKGSKTEEHPDQGSKITITWDLRRCP